MRFEQDRLGFAFEGDYPESYGPEDTVRLRATLAQQTGQLGAGTSNADQRLIGILIGRRCGDQARPQVEFRGRRDGTLSLRARGEVVIPSGAWAADEAKSVFADFDTACDGTGRRGDNVLVRRASAAPSDLDAAVCASEAAKLEAYPNYLATMAAVGKGLGGPEPTPPPDPKPIPATSGLTSTGGPESAAPPASDRVAGPATLPSGSGHAPIKVAVIDTGIPRALRDDQLLNGVERRDDNIDELDVLPAGPDGLLDYQAGHGTFVAGIIARVAPGAELSMYRAADTDGFATDRDIAEAILAAHADGAQIINLSLGVRTVDDLPPPATAAAVAKVAAESQGQTVIVAAAGNNGDEAKVWPADLDGVESVAGLTAYLMPAPWSSYGDRVRFSTVAEGIRSTYVSGVESPVFDPSPDSFSGDAWAFWSGTSFAAPQIAGAVARICQEEGLVPRAAVDKLDEFGKAISGYGKAMRILQGLG
ncbi:S8/S53 family peptidase [Actinoplanes sp. NPDC049265]|uniref:S8/S53 family peptidase n=1 Tax=Actinoplanes sp. NPDC049265 TaxID=3363902 RepID=UPI003712A9D4